VVQLDWEQRVLSNVGVASEFTNVSQMFARERVMKCANPDFDRYGGPDVMNLREVRVPEPLRGSVLDPRIGYPPVINKSADIDPCLRGAKRVFAPIPNSHHRLML
jgi:hypothetical protein